MNPEIESILSRVLNNYIEENIDNITFRINGENIELCKCRIAGQCQFTSSINESDISDEGLNFNFHVESYYKADIKNENNDIISVNVNPGIKGLSTDGTALIKKNPNYKDNSNTPESRDKYIVEIIEIKDNIITIKNRYIHL